MLGIIGAMDEEVAKLKETMQDVTVETKASMEFYKGTMNGKEVVVVRSGIGKVNAGICTQILCDLYHVDAVINTGIAGSLNAKIDIGDIVLSTDALQHDMDATGFGYEPGVIPRMETSTFIADEKLRKLAKELAGTPAAEGSCQRTVPLNVSLSGFQTGMLRRPTFPTREK